MSSEPTERRDISGIFFRHQAPDGKWENRVFEDLPEAEQDRVMDGRDLEWLKGLSKHLAASLRRICDQFDITAFDKED